MKDLWSEICSSRTPNGTEGSCRPERKLLSRRTTVAYKFTILDESPFQGIYFIIFMTYNFVPGNVPINYMLSLLSRPFVFPASPTIANKFLWKKNVFAKMKIVPNKRQNSFYCPIKRFIFIKKKKRFGSAAISLLIIVYCTYMRVTDISQHNAYTIYVCGTVHHSGRYDKAEWATIK